jgi:hypothetical protein
VGRLVTQSRDTKQRYAEHADDERPLGGYLVLGSTYLCTVAALAAASRRRGARLPERVDPQDIALIGVATHKLSRILSKAAVTSPLRAPFTRFRGRSGPGELIEETRGRGVHKAVGELATCPFCLGQWVATGFAFGLVNAPRTTRLVASVFAAVSISDHLQLIYSTLERAGG